MTTLMKTFSGIGGSFLILIFLFTACGGDKNKAEIQELKRETIAVHDEIMPQIASFDRQGIKIDTVLINLDSLASTNASLDTNQLRSELSALKLRLEEATDQMMTWMMEFEDNPQGLSTEEAKAYYESELEKIKNMKELFNDVAKESAEKLANY